jgi:hypothetical protein
MMSSGFLAPYRFKQFYSDNAPVMIGELEREVCIVDSRNINPQQHNTISIHVRN